MLQDSYGLILSPDLKNQSQTQRHTNKSISHRTEENFRAFVASLVPVDPWMMRSNTWTVSFLSVWPASLGTRTLSCLQMKLLGHKMPQVAHDHHNQPLTSALFTHLPPHGSHGAPLGGQVSFLSSLGVTLPCHSLDAFSALRTARLVERLERGESLQPQEEQFLREQRKLLGVQWRRMDGSNEKPTEVPWSGWNLCFLVAFSLHPVQGEGRVSWFCWDSLRTCAVCCLVWVSSGCLVQTPIQGPPATARTRCSMADSHGSLRHRMAHDGTKPEDGIRGWSPGRLRIWEL